MKNIRTQEEREELTDCGQNLQNAITCIEDLLSKLPEFGFDLNELRRINLHVWDIVSDDSYWQAS